jgi:dTDP-4-dehydrorhamnose reductase
MNKNILVLGADGMVGRTVFLYLQSLYPQHVWGTTRKGKKHSQVFSLTVENFLKDYLHIKNKLKHIDYIINCIGIIDKRAEINNLITVNALFPHTLEKMAEKYKSKLIHISTNGVFSPLADIVDESTLPSPSDNYCASKLLGETTSRRALNIRSSFIGFDPVHHNGLLELALRQKKINGYYQTLWTGCTSLQFAQFCHDIVSHNLFSQLRTKSNVIHFAPINPLSKYSLLQIAVKVFNKKHTIKKTKGNVRKTILRSIYLDLNFLSKYTNDIKKALQELLAFEKSQQTYEV